ncbi:progesterone receptor isoform X1 [Anolis carolinensis]|uniref:progesterone receptor isoform X1 n=2 Tax=Anolis carolinensis TaxID=28377 RepID=UPI002F2B8D49
MKDVKTKSDARDFIAAAAASSSHLLPTQEPFPRREAFEAIDLSLDGILYPRSCEDGEEEEEEEEEEEDEEEEEEEGNAEGGCPSLDRVLETLLTPAPPSSFPQANPAPTWPFFGAERAQFEGKPDGDEPQSANEALPSKEADGEEEEEEEGEGKEGKEGGKPASGPGTRLPLAADGGHDFLSLLPLNSAYLAARTRQLLDGEGFPNGGGRGAFAAASASASASPPSLDLAPYMYPQHNSHPGDAQAGLKIKEETLGKNGAYLNAKPSGNPGPPLPPPALLKNSVGNGAAPHEAPSSALESVLYKAEMAASYGAAPCRTPAPACLPTRDSGLGLSLPSASASAAPLASPQAFYQPLAFPASQHLAGFKDALPPFYSPYFGCIRSDMEPGQSPQYGFESLPQKICLICGDEASGCHYGVLTCGSCKVFFKRAMEGQHNYLCAGRNDCIVDKIRRKNCPACRLRKCCQAGMILGGRKFKKFSKVKVLRALDVVALQQSSILPNESQVLAQRLSFSPNQEIQFIPPLISVLQGIEPEVVYAGYDNTQPETPSALMTCLNQLCERQLLCVVKWSKSLPGFRNLHIDDQITLIQYSWMSLMVFAMGWRSYKHVSGQMLYFAPDLILNEQRMKESSFYSLCLSMWQIPQEFVKLQVSSEEFLCMKALLLLSTVPLEGLRSQNQFDEMRSSYIRELVKAISLRQKGVVASSQRFYQLTKFMDSLHDLVKQLHLYCLNTFLQSRTLSVEFPEMMSEVIAAQLPKILAGMVKPLLFHKK